jgi:acetyl-CoA C-acetyltransferase
MTKSVLLGGARTPIGKLNGSLASKQAVELGGIAIAGALERASVATDQVDHVIMGQVLQGGAGQIPARQAAFKACIPKTATAETINRVCGSGMRAIALADLQIHAGYHSVVVAGGMESMTNAPYLLRKARGGYRMGDGVLEDMIMSDGLFSAIDQRVMGLQGDMVAAEERLSRDEQDAWALRSHQRAIAAQDSGRFGDEIVPVEIVEKRSTITVSNDEAPRRDTSTEALARLKPIFSESGTTTAGNAPGVNDGAAALVVSSDEWARVHGIKPLATIISQAEAAWDVAYLAYTPAMAAEIALKRAGLAIGDIDLVEINEAFASVALIASRRLGVDLDRLNVNGGAVALGHPIGASGARIVLSLALELRRRGGGLGLAAICSGGGQGDAIIIQVEKPS